MSQFLPLSKEPGSLLCAHHAVQPVTKTFVNSYFCGNLLRFMHFPLASVSDSKFTVKEFISVK